MRSAKEKLGPSYVGKPFRCTVPCTPVKFKLQAPYWWFSMVYPIGYYVHVYTTCISFFFLLLSYILSRAFILIYSTLTHCADVAIVIENKNPLLCELTFLFDTLCDVDAFFFLFSFFFKSRLVISLTKLWWVLHILNLYYVLQIFFKFRIFRISRGWDVIYKNALSTITP